MRKKIVRSRFGKGKATIPAWFNDDALSERIYDHKNRRFIDEDRFDFFEGLLPTKAFIDTPSYIAVNTSKRAWIDWLEEEEQGSDRTPLYWEELTEAWLTTPEEVGPVYVIFYQDGSWDIGDGWHRIAISIAHNSPSIYAIWGEEKALAQLDGSLPFDPFADLDKRQRLALRQALAQGTASAPTKIVRFLEKQGLAVATGHWHEPQEWGKIVRREPVFYLTSEGERVAKMIKARLEEQGE